MKKTISLVSDATKHNIHYLTERNLTKHKCKPETTAEGEIFPASSLFSPKETIIKNTFRMQSDFLCTPIGVILFFFAHKLVLKQVKPVKPTENIYINNTTFLEVKQEYGWSKFDKIKTDCMGLKFKSFL